MDTESLAEVALFEGMTDEELQDCAQAFKPVQVLMGRELTTEDDFGYSFYVVLEGKVRVELVAGGSVDLEKGDHFGEVALVTGNKRNATVKAVETCQLGKMMTWDFQQLLERNAAFESRIQASVAERS